MLVCSLVHRHAASMQLLIALATLLTSISAFSSIAMFGDSLSDDCTHGASRLIDDFYDTDQVTT